MIGLWIAASLAAASPAQPLAEAAHAIDAGRLDQARIMIANAVRSGASGPAIDRLLADLSYASGNWKDALPRYEALIAAGQGNRHLSEKAGIAAIKLGRIDDAQRLLATALQSEQASWKAWNAAGIVADHQGKWDEARDAYAKAASLAPDNADVLNNMGWSMLVQGRWEEALALIERAARLDPKSEKIAANLELAKVAVSEELPRRRKGEDESDWAARLNDAGVIARVQGDRQKAVAAFARAVEARSQYYERAANNLASMEGR